MRPVFSKLNYEEDAKNQSSLASKLATPDYFEIAFPKLAGEPFKEEEISIFGPSVQNANFFNVLSETLIIYVK